MNSYGIKLILLCCLVIQAGCDITFKRKSHKNSAANSSAKKAENTVEVKNVKILEAAKKQKNIEAAKKVDIKKKVKSIKKVETKNKVEQKSASTNNNQQTLMSTISFTKNDKATINLYYKDNGNAIILEKTMKRHALSKEQEKKLIVSDYVPANVHVIPLPLELENKLSDLSIAMLRVLVGKNIILMNVASRKIIDIIKL